LPVLAIPLYNLIFTDEFLFLRIYQDESSSTLLIKIIEIIFCDQLPTLPVRVTDKLFDLIAGNVVLVVLGVGVEFVQH
jgi:hypothetical protein